MSYFDRLEKKLKELEDSEKQHYDNLLKIEDLTHKAKAADDFNKLESEFRKTQAGLLAELREVEKEKEVLVHMRKAIEDKTGRLKSMIMDFKHNKSNFESYLSHLKKDVVHQFKKMEGDIFRHSDYLVNLVQRYADIPNPYGDNEIKERRESIKTDARNYYIKNCSRMNDVKVKRESEFENRKRQIEDKEKTIKNYIDNAKKIIE